MRKLLTQRLIFSLHDCISKQRTRIGIFTVKVDDRISGSVAVLAELLDVRRANDLHRRISRECRQRREFSAAGASNAPGGFKHARSSLTVCIDPLADIVVPSRSHEGR